MDYQSLAKTSKPRQTPVKLSQSKNPLNLVGAKVPSPRATATGKRMASFLIFDNSLR